ncbi:MAG: DNA recombination protein RmuC, partial [Verrucomicrobia bacterium]|nr:DNA recombination protein RmuC [Verrucomicrobiota bacterium]
MEITISLIIGIILGLALGYYLWRNQTGNNQTQIQAELLAAKNLASEIEKIKAQELARIVSERDEANQRLTAAEKALSTAQEAKSSADRSLAQLIELKDEIEKRMREAFASASQNQLTQGRADLLSAAEEKFAPFRNQLDELKKTSAELRGSLTANNESAEKVAKEARKLAEAMTSTTKQGNWGELQLKRVAE